MPVSGRVIFCRGDVVRQERIEQLVSSFRGRLRKIGVTAVVSPFTRKIIDVIMVIPAGKICSYGILAARAGNPSGARQVARVLHSCSQKYGLPWHRVVNRDGKISLAEGKGHERQKRLLEGEGVVFDDRGRIDMDTYLWWPE